MSTYPGSDSSPTTRITNSQIVEHNTAPLCGLRELASQHLPAIRAGRCADCVVREHVREGGGADLCCYAPSGGELMLLQL